MTSEHCIRSKTTEKRTIETMHIFIISSFFAHYKMRTLRWLPTFQTSRRDCRLQFLAQSCWRGCAAVVWPAFRGKAFCQSLTGGATDQSASSTDRRQTSASQWARSGGRDHRHKRASAKFFSTATQKNRSVFGPQSAAYAATSCLTASGTQRLVAT